MRNTLKGHLRIPENTTSNDNCKECKQKRLGKQYLKMVSS